MSRNIYPIFGADVVTSSISMTGGAATSWTLLSPMSSDPRVVTSMYIINNYVGTSINVFKLGLSDNTNIFPLAMLSIPPNSMINTGGGTSIDVMRHLNMIAHTNADSSGNRFFVIPGGMHLMGAMVYSVANGSYITSTTLKTFTV